MTFLVATMPNHQRDLLLRDIARGFDGKFSRPPGKFVRTMMWIDVFLAAFLYFYLVLHFVVWT